MLMSYAPTIDKVKTCHKVYKKIEISALAILYVKRHAENDGYLGFLLMSNNGKAKYKAK